MKNIVALLSTAVMATAAYADGLPAADIAPQPTAATATKAFPGVFGAASAVAAPPNSGYVGLTYADPRGGISGNGADGDLFAGYTVGNPVDNVSLTFGLSLTSVSTDDFADSGALSLSASRLINVGPTSVTFIGATLSNLAAWGDASVKDEGGSIQISHVRDFQTAGGATPVQFTGGYATENTYKDDGSGDLDDGLFFGMGVGLSQNFSAGFSFTETQLNVGATATIPTVDGLSVTAGVYDATDNVDRQQYSLSIVYSF